MGEICCDMLPAFISGVSEAFDQAEITFDRFHIMRLMQEAVDRVRRQEAKETDLLKKTRYLWLKNPWGLTLHQRVKLGHLSRHKLKTGRAYRTSLPRKSCSTNRTDEQGKRSSSGGTSGRHSRLQPVIAVAKAIKRIGVVFSIGLTAALVRDSWRGSTVSFRQRMLKRGDIVPRGT